MRCRLALSLEDMEQERLRNDLMNDFFQAQSKARTIEATTSNLQASRTQDDGLHAKLILSSQRVFDSGK